jgi:excisionase family DNA binding protein
MSIPTERKKEDWYNFAYSKTSDFARLFIKNGLPKLLSLEQTALLFQVHKETIRRWNDKGQIKAIRVQKGQRRDRKFKREEVFYILKNGLREKNEQ